MGKSDFCAWLRGADRIIIDKISSSTDLGLEEQSCDIPKEFIRS